MRNFINMVLGIVVMIMAIVIYGSKMPLTAEWTITSMELGQMAAFELIGIVTLISGIKGITEEA